VLCDVRTPFELAAARFAPQKGADESGRGATRAATRADGGGSTARSARRTDERRGGAASRAVSWAAFDAVLVPGAPFVLDALDFDRRLRASHAVVLAEGRLDATTLDEKRSPRRHRARPPVRFRAHAIVAINALDAFDARIL